MGSFIVNYQIRSQSQQQVRDALITVSQTAAFISPAKGGWVTIYHEESDRQDEELIKRLASGLSRALKTAVFGFLVHDSDVAQYWLHQNGQLVDEFNSDPEYFGGAVDDETRAQLSGDTDTLLPLCIAGTTREQIDAVIHPPDGLPTMAEDLLSQIGQLLGMDEQRIMLGYEYFENEGETFLDDAAEFEPIGKGVERKTAGKYGDTKEAIPTAIPEAFDLAVSMLTHVWDLGQKIDTNTFSARLKTSSEEMFKRINAQYDLAARDFLSQSNLANRPSLEELKFARDQGPEALAELIAQRVPSRLNDIGMEAVVAGQTQFLTALLARGLQPDAKNSQNVSLLSAAKRHGKNSEIHQLLELALKERS